MKLRDWSPTIVLTVVGVVSLGAFLWAWFGSFGACVYGQTDESYQKTIAALDGIADLGLKLSTSLVGFGAALLIGLKGGLSLTAPVRTFLLISMLMFTQSALYAVWWRIGIAESWLNDCLNLVVEDHMQRRYQAHLWFFVLGLASLGALVFVASLARRGEVSQKGGQA
jgi:hypothetical protein